MYQLLTARRIIVGFYYFMYLFDKDDIIFIMHLIYHLIYQTDAHKNMACHLSSYQFRRVVTVKYNDMRNNSDNDHKYFKEVS